MNKQLYERYLSGQLQEERLLKDIKTKVVMTSIGAGIAALQRKYEKIKNERNTKAYILGQQLIQRNKEKYPHIKQLREAVATATKEYANNTKEKRTAEEDFNDKMHILELQQKYVKAVTQIGKVYFHNNPELKKKKLKEQTTLTEGELWDGIRIVAKDLKEKVKKKIKDSRYSIAMTVIVILVAIYGYKKVNALLQAKDIIDLDYTYLRNTLATHKLPTKTLITKLTQEYPVTGPTGEPTKEIQRIITKYNKDIKDKKVSGSILDFKAINSFGKELYTKETIKRLQKLADIEGKA